MNQYKMIGNAVPPRLGYVLAKSILSAFSNQQYSETTVVENRGIADTCTLVGYFKGEEHKKLILQNRLSLVV